MKITSLSLQMGKTDCERSIVWYADYCTENAAVQYMPKADYLKDGSFNNAKKVFGTVENIFADNENVSCKVKIKNLEPNTEYIYRVGDGTEFDNKTYCFFTQSAEASSRSFAVISDLHCMYKPEKPELWEYRLPMWERTIKQINAYDPDIAFLLSAGDNISSYNMGMDNEKEKMRLICEKEHEFLFEPELMRSIAFATVMGNHEAQYYPSADPYSSVAAYHFDMPNDDGKSGHFDGNTPGNFYFKSGNILIIGMNLTVDGAANRPNTDFKTNELFIKRAVEENPDAVWRVMITHIQGYTFVGPKEETEIMIDMQDELCSKFGIDVMLTGHAHAFSRSYPIKNKTALKNLLVTQNGVDCAADIDATVHYNLPSALNHSFTNYYEAYEKYIRVAGAAKMRNKDALMPQNMLEYDSPMFLHISTKEDEKGIAVMEINTLRSDTLQSIDEFILKKQKFLKK